MQVCLKIQSGVSTPLSEVKQEPYNLPSLYEWITCDMGSEDMCNEVYNLLTNKHVEDDENMFSSKEVEVAFITGIPARIRVGDNVVHSWQRSTSLLNHKSSRSLAPVMIKEVWEKFTWRISGKQLTLGFFQARCKDDHEPDNKAVQVTPDQGSHFRGFRKWSSLMFLQLLGA
ncbi:hypothetical protein Leryth_017478 [Lithospermum erythrorhizon]|nr:hypothetical protein Leryth_017478 [Lithospermum erythrorhizon]